jgi:hypothetical protein
MWASSFGGADDGRVEHGHDETWWMGRHKFIARDDVCDSKFNELWAKLPRFESGSPLPG